MKTLAAILFTACLTGCVTATYHHDGTTEDFKVTSLMKSVDGLDARRGDFSLSVDQTHSQDPAALLAEINKLISQYKQ